jgi:hypothetical protein
VQVTAVIARHCPFLLESDILLLSSDLYIHPTKRTVLDKQLGLHHRIEEPAGQLLRKLSSGIRVDNLREEAKHLHIEDSQYTELLGFVNVLGGLVRRRRITAWPHALMAQGRQLLLGIRYSSLTWRHATTARTVLVGALRASAPVIAAICLLCVFMQAVGVANIAQTAPVAGYSFAIFLCSLWIHELGHVAIAKANGMATVVLQKGMRLGIIHTRMTPAAEALSSVAGPVLGILVTICLSLVASMQLPILVYLSLIGSAVQLGSLLPWYGDGASLKRALKQ